MKANLIERMFMTIAPQTALRRAQAKALCRTFYDSADVGRRNSGWISTNNTGEQTDRQARDIIRARARDLERNDDGYKSIILDLERNVIGRGIMLQSKVMLDSDNEDDSINNVIEEAWKEWCKPENCTVTGTMSLSEVQRMVVRRRFVDGGILIIQVVENKHFRLQLLEVDALDSSIVEFNNNVVIGGIEINQYNRPLAYHIRQRDAAGLQFGKSVRIEASRVKYIRSATRVSQIREISQSASCLSRMDDVKQLIEAAIKKEQVQACFSVAITSEASGVGMGRSLSGDASGQSGQTAYPDEILYPGMIKHLMPGEDIKAVSPAGQSSTADNLIRSIQRQAGSGAGLSYEAATRDMSQVNYSSARQGLLQDRKTYGEWQQYIIEHFLQPVFVEWLQFAVLNGDITLPEYWKNPKKYEAVQWVPPGWEWIDPLKEANANKVALETGQTTLQKICASRGEDYKEILQQRAREQKILNQIMNNAKEVAKANDSENKAD